MLEYKDEASPLIADFLRFMSLQCNRSDATVNEYYLDLRIFFRFIKRDRGAVDPDMPFEEIPINDIDLEFVRNIKKTDINNYVDFLRSERSIHHAHGGDSNGIGPAALRIDETCEALKADDLNVLVGKAVAELAAALLVHDIGGLLRCQDVNLADALSLHLADGVHHGLAADVAIRI